MGYLFFDDVSGICFEKETFLAVVFKAVSFFSYAICYDQCVLATTILQNVRKEDNFRLERQGWRQKGKCISLFHKIKRYEYSIGIPKNFFCAFRILSSHNELFCFFIFFSLALSFSPRNLLDCLARNRIPNSTSNFSLSISLFQVSKLKIHFSASKMKLSTSSSILGMIASVFCFLASDNLALGVFAIDEVAEIENAPVSVDPIFDSGMNHLFLQGLDPREPLTEDEAAFVESAIKGVFNKIHQAAGIDLSVESVSVGTHAAIFFDNSTLVNSTTTDNPTGNLRGGRNLELGFSYNPESDLNFCHYQRGPKRGEWIPGCEFDITLYITDCCWMCIDDDAQYGKLPEGAVIIPTSPPTFGFRHFMLLDDDYDHRSEPTKMPTKNPTGKPTRKPTRKPTVAAKPKNFDKEVLKKLKNSPYHRLHKVRKVRFGGFGN